MKNLIKYFIIVLFLSQAISAQVKVFSSSSVDQLESNVNRWINNSIKTSGSYGTFTVIDIDFETKITEKIDTVCNTINVFYLSQGFQEIKDPSNSMQVCYLVPAGKITTYYMIVTYKNKH